MMKYVQDVDSGEIFPVPDNNEQNIDIPGYVKNDFPVLKVDYSGENDTNDIIEDLSQQLIEEKKSKTAHHDFSILKTLCAMIASFVIIICGTIGINLASCFSYESAITKLYHDALKNKETIVSSVDTADGKTNDAPKSEETPNRFPRKLFAIVTVVGIYEVIIRSVNCFKN